jgi:hypothetical protein
MAMNWKSINTYRQRKRSINPIFTSRDGYVMLSHKSNRRRIKWLSKPGKIKTEKKNEYGHPVSTHGKAVV